LRQVISNILDNAIKYTPSPGRIGVSLTQQNGSAHLRINDTGIGIDSEHLPRVFDRFYRVDRARPRSGAHGAGLGLAICRSILEAHGGGIGLSSRPAEGTTVEVVMPVYSG
jgi:two-component system phosphate regulon sensor histidine kinase PhoR